MRAGSSFAARLKPGSLFRKWLDAGAIHLLASMVAHALSFGRDKCLSRCPVDIEVLR